MTALKSSLPANRNASADKDIRQNSGKTSFEIWQNRKIAVPLHPQFSARAFSSVGLEHLPYKQRVGGSNPSTPTGVVPVASFVGLREFFLSLFFQFLP